MLKKTIKYEDYNGDIRVEDFYFNLTRTELIEMEFVGSNGGSFTDSIRTLMSSPDNGEIIKTVKHIILSSYGEKSADGRRFVKNDEVREAFVQSPAYDALYMELSTDAQAASDFFNGLIPASISSQMESMSKEEIIQKWKDLEEEKIEQKLSESTENSN